MSDKVPAKYSKEADMTLIIKFVFIAIVGSILSTIVMVFTDKNVPSAFDNIFNFLENIALMIVSFHFSKHIPTLPPKSAGRPVTEDE